MRATIALHLILLHTPDGHVVEINPAMVTSLHAAKEDAPNKQLTDAVRCLISLADGKFVSVVENCDTVKQLLEGSAHD